MSRLFRSLLEDLSGWFKLLRSVTGCRFDQTSDNSRLDCIVNSLSLHEASHAAWTIAVIAFFLAVLYLTISRRSYGVDEIEREVLNKKTEANLVYRKILIVLLNMAPSLAIGASLRAILSSYLQLDFMMSWIPWFTLLLGVCLYLYSCLLFDFNRRNQERFAFISPRDLSLKRLPKSIPPRDLLSRTAFILGLILSMHNH
jgi:hypothetical protein